MARPSKEHILSEIRRLADANNGEPVGVRRFEAETGISQWDWSGRYWARWGDAVREAGYEPGEWNVQGRDDNELLQILAELAREYGRLPTVAELRMRKQSHPDTPIDAFRRRFGGKSAMHDRLLAYAQAQADYADVASILLASAPGRGGRTKPAQQELIVTGAVYLVRMGEFHKIGKSNDPGRRLYEVGLKLPEKHDVVHVIETDDPAGIEAYWHRRFASQRTNGEWFRLSQDDIAAFIRRSYM